jgi:hypothetical protein
MTVSGSCSSFSVATTVFVSLAICAVISYGVFYYFKQRLTVIEQSQMEQARIMQALISRGLAQQIQQQGQQQQGQQQQQQGQQQQQQGQSHDQLVACHKEITITHNGLIEVSSDSDSEDTESESDSETESGDSKSESESESESEPNCDKWSIGDEIHNSESIYDLDDATNLDDVGSRSSSKKIISLNQRALVDEHADHDADDSSESSSDDDEKEPEEPEEPEELVPEFEVKIGYKSTGDAQGGKTVQLNYGNMSVSALRQLAKERGLGGEDGDLQKLKKKDLVQLLQ